MKRTPSTREFALALERLAIGSCSGRGDWAEREMPKVVDLLSRYYGEPVNVTKERLMKRIELESVGVRE